jgi:hypothetical protein
MHQSEEFRMQRTGTQETNSQATKKMPKLTQQVCHSFFSLLTPISKQAYNTKLAVHVGSQATKLNPSIATLDWVFK